MFEYKVLLSSVSGLVLSLTGDTTTKGRDEVGVLNELGAEGWEVVGMVNYVNVADNTQRNKYLLKRLKARGVAPMAAGEKIGGAGVVWQPERGK